MVTTRRCCLCGAKSPTSLHSFPKDPTNRLSWKKACSFMDCDDVSKLLVCSNHFTSENYLEPNAKRIGGRLRLKSGAVPSIISASTESINSRQLLTSSIPIHKEKEYVQVSQEIVILNPEQSPTVNVTELVAVSPRRHTSVSDDLQLHTPKKRRFHEPRYFGDIKATDVSSPRRATRAILLARRQIKQQNLRNRALQQKNRRLQKKVTSLQELVKHLKQKNVLSEEAGDTMMDILPESMKQLISRRLKSSRKYSPELRSFALSLQFYSSKAYNYVRKTWKNLLPHPSTLRAWYSCVGGKPGFTAEAFKAIEMQKQGKELIVNLVIDEMSIREQLVFDKNKFYGGVDLGTNIQQESENLPLAKNALVFMAVAVNGGWKVPVAYFLIKGLTGSERANLLIKCLELLHETGAQVHSLTFDGASVNISMCSYLGADFNYGSVSFKPWIIHPITKKKVFIFFDACHMIKLVRNTLGDKGIIVDDENNKINWIHIKELNNIQMKEGLHVANKLSNKHIYFDNNRMNVRLAVQTLSQSVASALLYLKESNFSITFNDCTGTIKFCLIFNSIFDLLNTRSKFGKRNKLNVPIDKQSYDYLKEQSLTFINYINMLKDPHGRKLLHGGRKIGFLGLIVNMVNVFSLYSEVEGKIDYLLTFKLSQDYLETFFSAIRSRGGFNNNPNAKQFQSAYRRLLIRSEIKLFDNSNCLADGIDILHFSSKWKNFAYPLAHETVPTDIFDHDYVNTMWSLNSYVENVIEYISGFVAKKVFKLIYCSICRECLISDREYVLIKIKNREKLVYPSKDVVTICTVAEKVFREHITKLAVPNIKLILCNKIFNRCAEVVFVNNKLLDHIKNQDFLDNHVTQLTKLVIDGFLNVRLFHESKLASSKDDYIRCKYNRLILFKNQ